MTTHRHFTPTALAALLTLITSFLTSTYLASPAHADEALPPCASTVYMSGLEVHRWEGTDWFKIVITPADRTRVDSPLNRDTVTNDMWHTLQACIGGLEGSLADSIYQQLQCHVYGALIPDPRRVAESNPDGIFATGPTFDLESWAPALPKDQFHLPDYWTSHCGNVGQSPAPTSTISNDVKFPTTPVSTAPTETAPAPRTSSPQGTISWTYGQGLYGHSAPGLATPTTGLYPDGTPLTILCQVTSDPVYNDQLGLTSSLWDKALLPDGSTHYFADAYVDTGVNGQVAGTC